MVDIPGNSTTTSVISVGGTTSNSLETAGDHDWFKISLTAGQSISVAVDGITLEDSYVRIYDASGTLLYENDDINPGVIRDSLLAFTATQTGTYYIDVGAFEDSYAGTYQLSVSAYTPPPLGTVDQLADQLVNGYWGGDSHHFNVTQGGTITVNLTALTAAGQTLARAALGTWSDIIGVAFTEVSSGGQISFDDNEDGAFSDGIWSNGIISSAHVNVSTGWLADYGTGLHTYSFQTYIHEIGHALGLGHQGNYNGDARYPYDALFENDSWALSVMSYFSQADNSYVAGQGFDENLIMTPMMADILAMSILYGLSTTTRTGNTTYGFNSNANRATFNASLYPDVAYTIYDSGGTDTLDYSGFADNQTINLNPETFSNVGGHTGNVSIARGVIIENAIGGSGNDKIIGNAGNNVLSGGGGEDILTYETATAAVRVDLTKSTQQDTIGAGKDTLSGFEHLIGSAFNDTLTGSAATLWIFAGGGNDVIISTGTGEHRLFGEDGDDRFVAGKGNDWFIGGDGFDTVDYSGATGSIDAATNDGPSNTGNSGFDTMGVEKLIGSNFNDTLWAFYVGHEAWGGAGNDTLRGSPLGASQLYGGTGNDIFEVRHAANQVIEAAGEGTDLVLAEANFTLGSNIENLTLVQPMYDPYAGASVNPGPPFADFYGTGNDLANVITGNAGANALSGLAGGDRLYGNGGNDALDGGTGDDYLYGRLGNDTLVGGAGHDRMYGGAGDDIYYANDATDFAYENAGEGHDLVITSIDHQLRSEVEDLVLTGAALIGQGNAGDNGITGSANGNKLYGYGGNDIIDGAGGDDYLAGAEGHDTLTGGAGYDKMYGGLGDDIFIVTDATDFCYENAGEGNDRVIASLTHSLRANIEVLELAGSGDIRGYGNGENNLILGNSGANLLYGRDGKDSLLGNAGNDLLYGENGNDSLNAGSGQDRFYGGTGADEFIFGNGDFAGLTSSNSDRIMDFSQAEGDIIRLDGVDANSALDGDQAFAFLGTAAFTGTAGELRYFQNGSTTYVQGDTNGDGIADFLIRLDGLHALGSDDFVM